MKENELITMKEARNNLIEREDVFDDTRVKALSSFLLPKDFGATTQMVADYFEVDKTTIEYHIYTNKEHEKELKENGLHLEFKDNLLTLSDQVKTKRGGFDILDENGRVVGTGSNKGIMLFTRRSILNLAMMLEGSEVAKQIRTVLLDATENTTVIKEIVKDNQEDFKDLLFAIYNGGQDAVLASKKITEIEVAKATKPLLETIEEQKPAVTFTNTVLKSKDNILMRQLAKIACDEGINIGEKKLYRKLREWKMIMVNSTEPYQKYINNGTFVLEEKTVNTPYGVKITHTTKVTPIGQIRIIERLKEEMR